MNKNNWITADEMRMIRREWINYFLQINRDGHRKYTVYQVNVRRMVRDVEIRNYSMELKRYYYYEYH